MLREVERLADHAAHAAGDTGAIAQLGAAWGITKQAARLRWPGAVRKPNDTSGQAEPFEKGGFRVGGHRSRRHQWLGRGTIRESE